MTPRPLACCDCGTTEPNRFDPKALRNSTTCPWPDTNPDRWTKKLWTWRMSGRPFGASHDFGFCRLCAVKARVRFVRRARTRAERQAKRRASA